MTAAPAASLLARLTIVPIVLLLVAVIAHGGFGVGRDTTPRTHSLRNAQACLECHHSYDDYGLREPLPLLCARCHALEESGPRADRASQTAGTCTDCHDPHGKTREPSLLLRDVARASDSTPACTR